MHTWKYNFVNIIDEDTIQVGIYFGGWSVGSYLYSEASYTRTGNILTANLDVGEGTQPINLYLVGENKAVYFDGSHHMEFEFAENITLEEGSYNAFDSETEELKQQYILSDGYMYEVKEDEEQVSLGQYHVYGNIVHSIENGTQTIFCIEKVENHYVVSKMAIQGLQGEVSLEKQIWQHA